jgi:hypothetical protein
MRSSTKSWQPQAVFERSRPFFWKLTALKRGRARSVPMLRWMDSFACQIPRRTGSAFHHQAKDHRFRGFYAQTRLGSVRNYGMHRTLPQEFIGITGPPCRANEWTATPARARKELVTFGSPNLVVGDEIFCGTTGRRWQENWLALVRNAAPRFETFGTCCPSSLFLRFIGRAACRGTRYFASGSYAQIRGEEMSDTNISISAQVRP